MLQLLKMEEGQMKEMKPATKYAGLGAARAAELMVGFWFCVGVILVVGVLKGLNYFVGAQVNAPNVEVLLQVMTKYPKKVAVGRKLTEWNVKIKKSWSRRLKLRQVKLKRAKSNLSYGVGTVIVVGALGLLGYYI